jgi:hypothetical protein
MWWVVSLLPHIVGEEYGYSSRYAYGSSDCDKIGLQIESKDLMEHLTTPEDSLQEKSYQITT